ncbi:MAG: protease inhibitor I42 family protein, partial [Acidobacteriia bacterium]|nr:protease inhibitor I42 family protein [Terriglobia bacterium]
GFAPELDGRLAMLRPLLLGLWTFTFVAVCVSAGPTVRLTAKDNGRTITVRKNAGLALTLSENPSTGYSWQVVSSGRPVIQQTGEPTFKPDSRLHGAGGTAFYRFKAVVEGTSTLKLVYRRPWEKDVDPAASFEVNIVVRQ